MRKEEKSAELGFTTKKHRHLSMASPASRLCEVTERFIQVCTKVYGKYFSSVLYFSHFFVSCKIIAKLMLIMLETQLKRKFLLSLLAFAINNFIQVFET